MSLLLSLLMIFQPFFTMAQVDGLGSWQGYRADIQVKPLTFAIWPGGYLSDGTFVQSGFIDNWGNGLYTFAWATNDTTDANAGLLPLTYQRVNPARGSWVTFELVKMNKSLWRFRYKDTTGWHIQGYFRSKASMHISFFASEYWASSVQPFAKQVMRNIQLRKNGKWITPSNVFYTAMSEEQCAQEKVSSPKKGVLVFESVDQACTIVKRLW